MAKAPRSYPRPISEYVRSALGDVFARQGFASADLITHWTEIAGQDIARLAEPIKLQWPRTAAGQDPEPATLQLRVEGPAAIEVQHLSPVILERVNRFFGWRAVARIAIRQAPLRRMAERVRPAPPSADETAAVAQSLQGVAGPELRDALARLGAMVRRR
jgi:hypothetical protein